MVCRKSINSGISFVLCVQAIRVLGALGALDPYRHKVHLGEVSLSNDSGAMSEAKPLQDAGQQGIITFDI